MTVQYQMLRGTRKAIDKEAALGSLLPGQPLLITDEERYATAVSKNRYITFAKSSELSDLASDSVITPEEKPAVQREFATLFSERAALLAQAQTLGVPTASYNDAVTALDTYLNNLSGWSLTPGPNIDIVPATFYAKFQDVYSSREALLLAISGETTSAALAPSISNAATTATWSGVSGTGKPQDNANYTTNTNQLIDGALLGQTAAWAGVSGIPKDKIYSTEAASTLGFNPSFEAWGATDYPDGWYVWNTPVPQPETSIVRFGSKAVSFTCSGADIGMHRLVSWTTAPLPAGTIIAGTVDLYLPLDSFSSGLPGVLVRLFTNSTLSEYVDTRVQPAAATDVWQRIPFTARTGASQQIYGVEVYIMGSWTGFSSGPFTGRVIFDGLTFSFLDSSIDADRAQAAAIAAAATDATTKANAAQAAAQAYAVAQKDLAVTTSNAYADGIVTPAENRAIAAAQVQADAARDAAIAAAFSSAALLNSNITVSGGVLSGIGSGTGTQVDNSYAHIGQNLIPNSEQASAITWGYGIVNAGASFDTFNVEARNAWGVDSYALPGSGAQNVCSHQSNVTAGGENDPVLDLYPLGAWDLAHTVQVIPGQRYMFSCYVQTHRCKAGVGMRFHNAAYGEVSIHDAVPTLPTYAGDLANSLTKYTRLFVSGVAPAGATCVNVYLRKYNTRTGTESYIWYAAPQLEAVSANATEPSPYVPGAANSTRQLGYSGELNATYGANKDTLTARVAPVNLLTAGSMSVGSNSNTYLEMTGVSGWYHTAASGTQLSRDYPNTSSKFGGPSAVMTGIAGQSPFIYTETKAVVETSTSSERGLGGIRGGVAVGETYVISFHIKRHPTYFPSTTIASAVVTLGNTEATAISTPAVSSTTNWSVWVYRVTVTDAGSTPTRLSIRFPTDSVNTAYHLACVMVSNGDVYVPFTESLLYMPSIYELGTPDYASTSWASLSENLSWTSTDTYKATAGSLTITDKWPNSASELNIVVTLTGDVPNGVSALLLEVKTVTPALYVANTFYDKMEILPRPLTTKKYVRGSYAFLRRLSSKAANTSSRTSLIYVTARVYALGASDDPDAFIAFGASSTMAITVSVQHTLD